MSKQSSSPRSSRSTTSARTALPNSRAAAKPVTKATPFHMPFERKNVLIIILGIVIIALGYFIMWVSPTMSSMALTVAPIVLLIGYLIVVPMGILAGTRAMKHNPEASEEHPVAS